MDRCPFVEAEGEAERANKKVWSVPERNSKVYRIHRQRQTQRRINSQTDERGSGASQIRFTCAVLLEYTS